MGGAGGLYAGVVELDNGLWQGSVNGIWFVRDGAMDNCRSVVVELLVRRLRSCRAKVSMILSLLPPRLRA